MLAGVVVMLCGPVKGWQAPEPTQPLPGTAHLLADASQGCRGTREDVAQEREKVGRRKKRGIMSFQVCHPLPCQLLIPGIGCRIVGQCLDLGCSVLVLHPKKGGERLGMSGDA